jgi:hypothetical protein
MAIEALQNLDRGNRVVQRIVDYLSHLALVVLNLRESSWNHHSITTLCRTMGADNHPQLAISSLDGDYTLPSVNNSDIFPTTNNNHQDQFLGGTSNQNVGQKNLPLEVDLSEFMLDTDLDWLYRHFEADRHY